MGFHMAANVRKKMLSSATFYVFDVNEEACQCFIKQFGSFGPTKIVGSSKDIAELANTIISMVPMDEHARAVYLDREKGAIAARPDANRLILECSTISIATTQAIGKAIMDAGVGVYVDTPVSGGVRGAEAGTLSFFCGYPAAADADSMANRIQQTVGLMGSSERISFCSQLGRGLVSKMVNNYIGLTNIAVASQGLAFGLRHGMDASTLYKCVKGSSGDSWILNATPPVPGLDPRSPSSNGFRPGFSARLCAKDIALGIEAAAQVGIDATLGKMAVKMFQQAEADPRTKVNFPRWRPTCFFNPC